MSIFHVFPGLFNRVDIKQVRFSYTLTKSITLCTQFNLSVESNQSVKSKRKSVEFRTEKVESRIFENMYTDQKCGNHLVYFPSLSRICMHPA